MKVFLSVHNNPTLTPWGFESFTFPGGEQHIRLAPISIDQFEAVKLFVRLNSAEDIMMLLMAVDAIREQLGVDVVIDLTVPYLPYARQDRVCYCGEPFGLRVMAKLINDLHLGSVTSYDIHSPVAFKLIDRLKNINQLQLLSHEPTLYQKLIHRQLTPVAPDITAWHKLNGLLAPLNTAPLIKGEKVRCQQTRNITRVKVNGTLMAKICY